MYFSIIADRWYSSLISRNLYIYEGICYLQYFVPLIGQFGVYFGQFCATYYDKGQMLKSTRFPKTNLNQNSLNH